MANPSGPDGDDTAEEPVAADAPGEQPAPDPDEQVTDSYPVAAPDAEAATRAIATAETAETEVFAAETEYQPGEPASEPAERRYTAPGFDARQTQVIQAVPEPPTEVFSTQGAQRAAPGKVPPQIIPPRLARRLPAAVSRSWGWAVAFILIILTVAAIVVLGAVWLTRAGGPKVSQEDRVRTTIENFDIAVQKGDLATLRSITCGAFRDSYVNYNDQDWDDTERRVVAAKQYPVVASIDEVVVNGDHAEANVTAFMAYAPQVRSTRSFDLQYRDDQWKICQTQAG